MIEDTRMRASTPSTQRGYIRAVKDFTAFLGRAPDGASAEDLRRHRLDMRSSGVAAAWMTAVRVRPGTAAPH